MLKENLNRQEDPEFWTMARSWTRCQAESVMASGDFIFLKSPSSTLSTDEPPCLGVWVAVKQAPICLMPGRHTWYNQITTISSEARQDDFNDEPKRNGSGQQAERILVEDVALVADLPWYL